MKLAIEISLNRLSSKIRNSGDPLITIAIILGAEDKFSHFSLLILFLPMASRYLILTRSYEEIRSLFHSVGRHDVGDMFEGYFSQGWGCFAFVLIMPILEFFRSQFYISAGVS